MVTLEAHPSAGSDAFGLYGGAFVHVYASQRTKDAALAAARQEVTDAGWLCSTVERVEYVTRNDFDDDSDELSHFEQALVDGIVLVFHVYPLEPGDDDVVH